MPAMNLRRKNHPGFGKQGKVLYLCRRDVIQYRIVKLIYTHIQQIADLCRKYKVNKLFAFGSILTPRFNSQSDIDLLVDFNKDQITDYFSNFFDLKYELEAILGREVDLVEDQAISNIYFRNNVDNTRTLLYGGGN